MSSNAGAVQRYRPSRIKEECNHEKVHGAIGTYYGGSAFVGLKVFAVDEHDYKVQFMWFYDGKPDSRMTTATIRHTGEGRPYFITRGRRVHMDEVMRDELGGWNL